MGAAYDPVQELAILRIMFEKAKAEQKQAADELAASIYGTALASAQKRTAEISASISAVEDQVRAAILEGFAANKDKKQRGGQVKRFENLMRYDEEQAIAFAIEKSFPAMLKLDKKVFEKAAVGLRPEFVEFYAEDRAQIDSDLSAFLPEDMKHENPA